MRIAVLDLGSISFRLVVAEADQAGSIAPISKKRTVMDLGLVVGREGIIPEPFAADAVNTVRALRAHAERLGAKRLIPVATSALRDAANRRELVPRLEEAAGSPIRFLTGEEEAELTFTALRAGFDFGTDTILGLDLGGGSLELVVGDAAGLDLIASVPLGAARLMGAFARHDPMKTEERNRLRLHIERTLRGFAAEVRARRPQRLLAAGGTVKSIARALAAEGDEDGDTVNGKFVLTDDILRFRDRVIRMRASKRARLPGVARHRGRVLPAGAMVLASVALSVGAEGLHVSEWGLREGIILQTLGWEDAMIRPGAAAPAPG